MRPTVLLIAPMLSLVGMMTVAREKDFTADQVRKGAALFADNCSPCHGPRMQGAESAFDLRKFPPDQRQRFLDSVMRGKNQMPPWGMRWAPIRSMRYGPMSPPANDERRTLYRRQTLASHGWRSSGRPTGR